MFEEFQSRALTPPTESKEMMDLIAYIEEAKVELVGTLTADVKVGCVHGCVCVKGGCMCVYVEMCVVLSCSHGLFVGVCHAGCSVPSYLPPGCALLC